MNHKMIIKSIGSLLCIEAACMVPAFFVALYYGQGDAETLALSITVVLLVGFLMQRIRPETIDIYSKDGLAIVGFGWIFLSIFGAIPFFVQGITTSWIDAVFETVSGFTTTGATVLGEVETLPRGILFWKAFMYWIGGMGVLVLMLALTPSVNPRTLHVMNAESPGPTQEKIVHHVGKMAKILYAIYVVMTVMAAILLRLGGMPLFDAVIHAFGTAATGGVSSRNESIAAFDNLYIDIVVIIFMLLCSINFTLYYSMLKGKVKNIFRDEELLTYLSIIIVAILLITFAITGKVYEETSVAFRHAAFQVVSVISSTGYASADFNVWPAFAKLILVMLMFIGACAGSTGGGMKCIRMILLLKAAKREIAKLAHPNAVKKIRMNGKGVEEDRLYTVFVYFFLFMGISLLAILLISLDGFDLATSATAVLSSMSNIGPALGSVGSSGNFSGFSTLSKCILALCMIIGRLEIYPILILFSPVFWKRLKFKQ